MNNHVALRVCGFQNQSVRMTAQRGAVIKQQIFLRVETQLAQTLRLHGIFRSDTDHLSIGLGRIVIVGTKASKPKDHGAVRRMAHTRKCQ